MGPVKIRLLSYDSHKRHGSRYISSARSRRMKRFDEWYGPYPYAQITVVDPPHGAGEAGGMEYPTFITGDSGWCIPKGVHLMRGRDRARIRSPVLVRHGGDERVREWLAG